MFTNIIDKMAYIQMYIQYMHMCVSGVKNIELNENYTTEIEKSLSVKKY